MLFYSFFAAVIPLLIIASLVMLIHSAGIVMLRKGSFLSAELRFILESTPALNCFYTFVICSAAVVTAVSCLGRVSKHAVITLDIIFLFSAILLILFHSFIKYEYPLSEIA